MTRHNQACTLCGKTSIPGLIKGQGKCQYHWNVGAFGKEWADKVAKTDTSPVPNGQYRAADGRLYWY